MTTTSRYLLWASVLGAMVLGGCLDGNVRPLTLGGVDPEDASFTILMSLFQGPNHVAEAESYKEAVVRWSGWNDIFVVHRTGASELCRGRYISRNKAEQELKRIKAWRNPEGVTPFARAMIMPLPPTQVGPPEWSLLRTTGMFTVVVAEFYDVPEQSYVGRKDFAVQYCRELRSRGKEAYYYHGPVKSLVTIGSFPESSYPSAIQEGVVTRVVRDPRINTIKKEFPRLAVNGREELRIVSVGSRGHAKLTSASYIMEIPRPEEDSRVITTPGFSHP